MGDAGLLIGHDLKMGKLLRYPDPAHPLTIAPSGITFGQQHVGCPLLTPDEVRTLSPERQILFLVGQRPMIVNKLRYYADREFAGRYDPA